MAELTRAQYEFVRRAQTIAHLLRSAELTFMVDGRGVALRFNEAVGQNAIRQMIGDFLEDDASLSSALTEYAETARSIPPGDVLQAEPAHPSEVEVRQWALALVMQVCGAPYNGAAMNARLHAANVFVQYAMTGAVPPDDPKPEDPA